ncbi:MAG: hypothetical protein AB7U82_04310 [Blastocatellales bacterium]
MVRITKFRNAVIVTLALLLTTFPSLTGAGADLNPRHKQSQAKTSYPSANAQAVLWRAPTDIESRDLFYGSGGRAGAPDPSAPFTFVRHSTSGTQKKIIVEDNRGRKWTVKFGPEARPETTATRIVWAAGYHVDQNYFVPHARIVGKENIDARNVRFERRDDGYEEAGNWKWDKNPFLGTSELEGLKVLMALLKNWDLKTKNNDILTPKKGPGPRIYYVSDLGGSLGQTGSFLNSMPLFGDLPAVASFTPDKAKGDPEAFADEKFIKEVRGGKVNFYFRRSRGRDILNGVPVECARWMGALLGRLSDQQLADAFCAGGFDPAETQIYVRTLRKRIRLLQQL